MATPTMDLAGVQGQLEKSYSDYLRDKRNLAQMGQTAQGISDVGQERFAQAFEPQGAGAVVNPADVFRSFQTFQTAAPSLGDVEQLRQQQLQTESGLLNQIANIAQARQPAGISFADQLKAKEQGFDIVDGQLVPAQGVEQGQVFFSPKERVEKETELRKEFRTATEDVDFNKVRSNYENIESAKPNAAGDLSLIFSYMKMLDPSSTVREGEFANAQNAAGIPGQIVNQYNKILRGTRLNKNQRSQFKSQAAELYNNTIRNAKQISEFYSQEANRFGIDPKSVVGVVGELEEVDVPEGEQQQGGILDFLGSLLEGSRQAVPTSTLRTPKTPQFNPDAILDSYGY